MPSTPTTVPFPATGTIGDGLLSGGYWLSGNLAWATADNPVQGFSWIDPAAAAPVIATVFQQFADVANLTFSYGGHFSDFRASTADITIAWADFGAGPLGAAVFPLRSWGDSTLISVGLTRVDWPQPEGDIGLNFSEQAALLANPNLFLWVDLHEIGHALGLKHPHDGGPLGSPTFAQLGISSRDTVLHTVMSYNPILGVYSSTLMPLDIAVLQILYGANTSTFAGDTTHQFTNDGRIRTIYDANGVDTLDGSSLTGAAFIDLRQYPSGYSSVGSSTVVATAIGTVIENANGGSGADQMFGNDVGNFLQGNSGNDFIDGGLGNDIVRGGAGADTMVGGGGFDGLSFLDSDAGVSVSLASLSASGGYAAGDSFSGFEDLSGSGFADQLTGDAAGNFIFGWDGNDVLQGNAGADVLDGAAGVDSLLGGDGDDVLIGGADADSLAGGAGTDAAYYASSGSGVVVNLNAATGTGTGGDAQGDTLVSVENVIGSAFGDVIIGRDFTANTLSGGDGNDVLSGGTGGADVMNGGAGIDTLDYSLSPNGVDVRLFSGAAAGGSANGDTYSGIENIIGAATKTDTLAGDTGANSIWGGGGNETITGREGADTLHGEAGNDTLLGGADSDTLIGGIGADTLGGGSQDDLVDYSASNAGVTVNLQTGSGVGGHAQGDVLVSIEDVIGSAFDDVIVGKNNVWDNIFDGRGGNDIYTGGLGNDVFVFRLNEGADTITDFVAGGTADAVELHGFGAGFDSFAEIIAAATQIGTDTIIDFGAGQTLTLQNVTLANLTSADFLGGSAFGGDANANSIWGGGGNETITGREGADTLHGEAGNDTLLGGADSDTLIGGIGADTLGGGSQDDLVDYSASNAGVTVNLQTGLGTGGHAQGDVLVSIEDVAGSDFDDVIVGKNNFWDNVFDGRGGNDTYTGGLGNDVFVFRAGSGADTVTDFSPLAVSNNDVVQLLGFAAAFDSFAEVIAVATQIGADTVLDFGGGQALTLQNVMLGNLTAGDFLFGP